MTNIPDGYKLFEVAQSVAKHMRLGLTEVRGAGDKALTIVKCFANPTEHLIQLAIRRGEVSEEVILYGSQHNKAFVHYTGAIPRETRKPIEWLYAADPNRLLTVTWGYPEDVGVLEILDRNGSIALQKLSGVTKGSDGRPVVIAHMHAPQPQPFRGVAQFREQDFRKLYHTIETLLE